MKQNNQITYRCNDLEFKLLKDIQITTQDIYSIKLSLNQILKRMIAIGASNFIVAGDLPTSISKLLNFDLRGAENNLVMGNVEGAL